MQNAKPFIDRRNDLLAAKVVRALENRHFEAFYCKTGEDAAQKVLSLLPAGESVSWGGSMTLEALGLPAKLHQGRYVVLDRDQTASPAERQKAMQQAFFCDNYITSTNAISEDGQLVNVDGNGNRVAAMTFGPKRVIVVAGINKIVRTLEDAVTRARTYAAPINVQRIPNLKTPCQSTGSCSDCKSDDCICSYVVTTRISRPAGRIKVILVGEPLGF